jgi:hypothetical protein
MPDHLPSYREQLQHPNWQRRRLEMWFREG